MKFELLTTLKSGNTAWQKGRIFDSKKEIIPIALKGEFELDSKHIRIIKEETPQPETFDPPLQQDQSQEQGKVADSGLRDSPDSDEQPSPAPMAPNDPDPGPEPGKSLEQIELEEKEAKLKKELEEKAKAEKAPARKRGRKNAGSKTK